MATDLYTVLPGLEVTQDEILQAELAAQKILEAQYPDLDIRQGTGLRDLVIRPAATLLALTNKAVIYYFAQNSISGITDNTSTDIVDKILSNWFMTRIAGAKSVISARMFFATKKNVTIGTEVFFSTDSIKKFYPITTYTFSVNDMTYDSFSAEYYVDIDLVADTEGPAYDLTTGSLLYFSNFDTYFLRGEINYLSQMSTVTETNSTFIARTSTSISTRNLINVPSIDARLNADFNYISSVTTVGYGDPEMYRDQVVVMAPPSTSPIMLHIGGKTDIYSRVPLQTQVLQYVTDSNGIAEIAGPYIEIDRSTFTGGTADDTIPVYTQITVMSLTSVGTLATATSVAHGYSVGTVVVISGATPTTYNGSFSVSSVTANTFTYVLNSAPGVVASGTILSSVPTPFITTYPNQIVKNASFSCALNVVTVASPGHGLIVGRFVLLSGAVQSVYNGWFEVVTVLRDSFTVANPALSIPAVATGTTLITVADYMNDTGFSSNQLIHTNFGAINANKTVSFTTLGFQGLTSIQAYLNDSSRKVLAGDMLARGYNIYYLTMNIIGYNGPPPSAISCSTVATAYLASLSPGAPFIMGDLIALLNQSSVVTIKTPIDITFKYFHRDNITPVIGVITDFLEPNDRTALFMLNTLTTANEYI